MVGKVSSKVVLALMAALAVILLFVICFMPTTPKKTETKKQPKQAQTEVYDVDRVRIIGPEGKSH